MPVHTAMYLFSGIYNFLQINGKDHFSVTIDRWKLKPSLCHSLLQFTTWHLHLIQTLLLLQQGLCCFLQVFFILLLLIKNNHSIQVYYSSSFWKLLLREITNKHFKMFTTCSQDVVHWHYLRFNPKCSSQLIFTCKIIEQVWHETVYHICFITFTHSVKVNTNWGKLDSKPLKKKHSIWEYHLALYPKTQ